MRVTFFEPSLHGGGAERSVASWAASLAAQGHAIEMLTYTAGAYDRFRPTANDVEWSHSCWPGRGGHLGLAAWLGHRVRMSKPDIVAAQLTYSNLIALCALRRPGGPAVIATEHNPPSLMLRGQGRTGRAKLALVRTLYRRADAVIGVSHPVAADVAAVARLRQEQFWVVPNAVLERATAPPGGCVKNAHLLFVGRLEEQKSPGLILDCLDELRRRSVSAEATFVGDGALMDELKESAARKGLRCHFLGWRESWPSSVRPADAACLVLPSRAEGFGNVLVEAAAAQIPVVAPSQALGIGDALVPGLTGVPALSNRPRHLANAVLEVISSKGRQHNPDRWLDWFGAGNSGRRLEEVFRTVVEERSQTPRT